MTEPKKNPSKGFYCFKWFIRS